jgi:LPS export ABC transporter protein LptC
VSAGRSLRLRTAARRLLLGALVAAAAGGALWFRGLDRGGSPDLPPAETPGPAGAEMVTRDFRHVETRMDRTVWILEAKRAEIREQRAQLTAVKITWYGEPGTVPVVITSDAGRINFAKRSAVLTGRVRAERADGAVLETERLAFDEVRKLLHAPRAVVITTPTFSFRGASLTANVAHQWVRLQGQVEGEIRGAAAAHDNS